MQAYVCRFCHWHLFATDQDRGHVTVKCPNRRCGKWQTVPLAAPPPPRPDRAPLRGAR